MFEKMKHFFDSELNDDMYAEMVHFLSSQEIREGKFEGNSVLLHKLDRDTVIVYFECEQADGSFIRSHEAKKIDIPILLELLRKWKSR